MTHKCSAYIPYSSANASANRDGKPVELVITVDGSAAFIVTFSRTEWLRLIRGSEDVQGQFDWEEDAA